MLSLDKIQSEPNVNGGKWGLDHIQTQGRWVHGKVQEDEGKTKAMLGSNDSSEPLQVGLTHSKRTKCCVLQPSLQTRKINFSADS